MARLIKKKREKDQINKIGNENGEITKDNRKIQRIIRDYYQQLYDNKMDQLDLIDIYRTFHRKTMNFSFFSSAHRTFSRIDHILGHNSNLGKFKKKIEIITSIFSDNSMVRLDVNYRKKKTIKNTNIWRLNNILLNNQ